MPLYVVHTTQTQAHMQTLLMGVLQGRGASDMFVINALPDTSKGSIRGLPYALLKSVAHIDVYIDVYALSIYKCSAQWLAQ